MLSNFCETSTLVSETSTPVSDPQPFDTEMNTEMDTET